MGQVSLRKQRQREFYNARKKQGKGVKSSIHGEGYHKDEGKKSRLRADSDANLRRKENER